MSSARNIIKDGDFSSNRIFGNELKYLKEVLETDFRTSAYGMMTDRLEKAFAKKIGVKFAVGHNSGTGPLHSMLESIGIEPGDEVIVTPLTMSAPTYAIIAAGGTPVYADIDPESFNISPESIEKLITPKTKAISAVALYGLPCDVDKILAIAKKHSLFVYEDNAQCMMGTYKGKFSGSLAHGASFSFQRLKHLTSGEGGMFTTNDEDLANKVRRQTSLGYANVGSNKGAITKMELQDPSYDRHISFGFKSRLPELCAAVALAQLENSEKLIDIRLKSAEIWEEVISTCDWLIPQKASADHKNVYWSYAVRIDHPKITWNMFRDEFVKMGGDGIYAAWKLSYQEPVLQNPSNIGWRSRLISAERLADYKRKDLCPVAENYQPKILAFKTDYWNINDAYKQAEILKKLIKQF